MENKNRKVDVLLWSIALPGFGQLLNRKFLKAVLFIGLEFLVNVKSKLNMIIIYSFHWDIPKATTQTNYQWLMFYPCVYMFAMWDAYRDAGGGKSYYAVLPMVVGAYVGTVGVIFSPTLNVVGVVFGPVWLGMMGALLGVCAGALIRAALLKWTNS
jgi:hypothetical protein